MMATTHGFVGLALAAVVATVAPELAVPAAIGAIAGGLAPDLDVVAEHRKTLHYPVVYSVIAVLTGAIALNAPTALSVSGAMFFVAASMHALSDIIGGIPALQPWDVTIDRAVYAHIGSRWIAPRQVIRYDGAPEDFFIGAAFAVPGLVVYDGYIQALAGVGLVVSLVYTVFRKPIGRRLAAS